MKQSRELPIPLEAESDANSFEILRIWLANNQQHVSLRPDVWPDPAAWGIMLADLAKHVANSYQDSGYDRVKTLNRIKAGLDAEFESPTDTPSGHISD